MKKFIVLYYAPTKAVEAMSQASPEETKKHMEPWMAWAKKCGTGLLDMGTPLGNGLKVTKAGSSPSKSQVTGYSILQAEDMKAAKKLVEGHPHIQWGEGCEVEVLETMALPG